MPKLAAEQLRRVTDPAELHFETTADVKPLESIVGQERAVRALHFGLGIDEKGFNVFVSGPAGTGKNTAIQTFIEGFAKTQPTPNDWCYVYNFIDSYRPRALSLPPGQGRAFRADMERFVQTAREQIKQAFESDEYSKRRTALKGQFDQERLKRLSQVEEAATHAGFALRTTQMGLFLVPLINGQIADEAAMAALTPEEKERLRRVSGDLEQLLGEAMKEIRRAETAMMERVRQLNSEVTRFAVGGILEDLREKYASLPEVVQHLKAVEADVVANGAAFLRPSEPESDEAPSTGRPAPSLERRYGVNVIVDNGGLEGAPVIFESNPSYFHLFGRIEREAHMGTLYTDFSLIKGGTLHTAAGGFLVLNADELLKNPLSWDALKRALREHEIELEEPLDRAGVPTTKSLRPLPIPFRIKVVLMGTPNMYALLYAHDPEFAELFKVKAEFDTSMPRTSVGVDAYVGLVGRLCASESLCNLDSSAVAKIIEHGSRIAEHQERLSTKFSLIADVLREASYWARHENAESVSAEHVTRALSERRHRLNLIEDRIQETIHEETFVIPTTGRMVGQVNGLTVLSVGDYTFGRPSRITCTVSLGQGGIVDIERQVKLGGPLHSKGVMILSGYLYEHFGQEIPLSLSARLVFEQSYSGVDGDSASCAELCAILSSLAEAPIRQEIAITGSIDQKGNVQAIGGVNEKIEGFYDVCKTRGLTGEQGVIIPHSNAKNLMLREDIVEAARAGEFHVYTVERVEEALSLLTGLDVGTRDADGTYPAGSVMHQVGESLMRMAVRLKTFNRSTQGGKTSDSNTTASA